MRDRGSKTSPTAWQGIRLENTEGKIGNIIDQYEGRNVPISSSSFSLSLLNVEDPNSPADPVITSIIREPRSHMTDVR